MTRNRLPGRRSAPKSDPLLARTASAPLPASERARFESRFGQDFSNVRIHAGTDGAAFADTMGAKAVTSGEDIAFAPGRYSPGTAAGRELLAHELAHVAQQREGGSAGPGATESAAHGAARTVAQGGSVAPQALGGAAEGGLYCDDDEAKQVPPPVVGPTAPPPLAPYRRSPSLMPQLQPPLFPMLPPLYDPNAHIDWLGMRAPFETRGMPFTMRDADHITAEWMRSKAMLDALGIDQNFKFWFIDQDWILNTGLNYQLDTLNARDNPNRIDMMQREWDAAMSLAGEWKTPIFSIFEKKF